MKTSLKIEELGIFLLSLFVFTRLELAAIILFAHSSLDRALGYGLKYDDSFGNTHLGSIGKKGNE